MPEINELTKSPEEVRNPEWEKQFLDAFINTKIKVLHEDPKPGPDNLPYLFVSTEEEGSEPAYRVAEWLSQRGVGMVVNPHKKLPDYIFSYGMIWNFQERKLFIEDFHKSSTSNLELSSGDAITVGEPSPEYLPAYVRKIMKEFFFQNQVLKPKILMLSADEGQSWDLCFSLESLKNPPPKEHEQLAEAISWFLPTHYSLALVSEKGLPEFLDL